LREKLDIPNCQIVIRVDREVWSPEMELRSCDTRYFLSSLDPDTVTDSDLARLVRGHWQVENSLHLVKDRWWDEDKHYLKRPRLGNTFAVLTNAALSVLRLVQQPGDPLTKTAENFHYQPRKSLQLIGLNTN
jgi:predicted transposase YbfD/YdcC